MKLGWKCVTKENVAYNLSMSVPAGMEQYALTEGINEFKTNFLRKLLPSSYFGTGLDVMTLTSTVYDPVKRVLNVGGVVDKINGVTLTDLRNTIATNVGTVGTLGPFGVISSDIRAFSTNQPNNGTFNNGTANQTVSNIVPVPNPEPVNNSPNLAAILIPSIIGGLLLLTLIPCLICYCCKWCCFKKKDVERIPSETIPEKTPIVNGGNTFR